jgi:capsid protein
VADILDLQELQSLEMSAAKDAAHTSKVIKTEQGELTAQQVIGDYNASTDSETAKHYQEVLGANSVVLRPGDTFEQFASSRPSVAVQSFWDHVGKRIAAGMGLPLEILIMSSLQGTMTRAALDMANGYFRCRSANLAEACGRVWEYVIGNSVALRRNRPGDWRKIRYTPPRAINVDVGRNSAALINEWRVGFRTLENISAEMGLDWREIIDQRAEEASYAAAKESSSGLPPGTLLNVSQPGAPAPQPATA